MTCIMQGSVSPALFTVCEEDTPHVQGALSGGLLSLRATTFHTWCKVRAQVAKAKLHWAVPPHFLPHKFLNGISCMSHTYGSYGTKLVPHGNKLNTL